MSKNNYILYSPVKKQYLSPEFVSLTIEQIRRITIIVANSYKAEKDKQDPELFTIDLDRQG